jgi:hypothetical protein
MIVGASVSSPLIALLVGTALVMTACNAILCELVNRRRVAPSVVAMVSLTIALSVGIGCFVGVLLYALGDNSAQRLGQGLIASGMTAIAIHICLWVIPTLYGRLDRV